MSVFLLVLFILYDFRSLLLASLTRRIGDVCVTASHQMDVALYVGLSVACIVIGGLAFFLTRLVQRKGRNHSLYSMARNGELEIYDSRVRKSGIAGIRHDIIQLSESTKLSLMPSVT